MFAWFFLSALYLQLVLGYTPLQVGLAFLPANLIMGALLARALGEARDALRDQAAARRRARARRRRARALRAGAGRRQLRRRRPAGMILLGVGAGMAFNPVLLAAMSDVEPEESGLASGVVNTAFMMGGALGLAVLASLADWRTGDLGDSGRASSSALTSGYHLAFVVGPRSRSGRPRRRPPAPARHRGGARDGSRPGRRRAGLGRLQSLHAGNRPVGACRRHP